MNRLLLAALVLALACTAEAADESATPATTADTSNPDGRPVPPAPVEEPLGCRNAFVPGPIALRSSSPGTDRRILPKSATPHFLDDCEPVGWTAGCEIEFGHQFCMNRQWTIVCKSDAHCPQGSRCTDGAIVGEIDMEYSDYGWCAPICDATLGDRGCTRPDMECATDLNVCMRIDRPPRYSVTKLGASPLEPKARHHSMVVQQPVRTPAESLRYSD